MSDEEFSEIIARGRIGKVDAIKPLILALGNPDDGVVFDAETAISFFKTQALDPLIQTLSTCDLPEVRRRVIYLLCEMPTQKSVKAIIHALIDQDIGVREAAATALGRIKCSQAVGPLIIALKDLDSNVREAAAEALGKLGSTEALNPLLVTLKDPAESVRVASAMALGEIGDESTLNALLELAGGIEPNRGAIYALGKLGKLDAIPVLEKILGGSAWRTEAVYALKNLLGSSFSTRLMLLLKDNDWSVRAAAATCLGDLKDRRAVESLIELLFDTDTNVQRDAAIALTMIEDYRALDPISSLLKTQRRSSAALLLYSLMAIGNRFSRMIIFQSIRGR